MIGCSDDTETTDSGQGTLECDAEPEVMTTSAGVDFVRTPDSCFDDIDDFPYEPRYVEIDGLRQAYYDEGPADADPVLLLHGQPSWSYLYRKMIPVLVEGGQRVIAMDHLGMGRSDKPTDITDYSYLGHIDRLERFIEELGLRNITAFVQDWEASSGCTSLETTPIGLRASSSETGRCRWFLRAWATFSLRWRIPTRSTKTSRSYSVRSPRNSSRLRRRLQSALRRRGRGRGWGRRFRRVDGVRHEGRGVPTLPGVGSAHLVRHSGFAEAAYDAPFPSRI